MKTQGPKLSEELCPRAGHGWSTGRSPSVPRLCSPRRNEQPALVFPEPGEAPPPPGCLRRRACYPRLIPRHPHLLPRRLRAPAAQCREELVNLQLPRHVLTFHADVSQTPDIRPSSGALSSRGGTVPPEDMLPSRASLGFSARSIGCARFPAGLACGSHMALEASKPTCPRLWPQLTSSAPPALPCPSSWAPDAPEHCWAKHISNEVVRCVCVCV